MYKHVDFFNTYGRIMQFNKNKKEAIHRWYPFVEGYSREFIQSIISEMETKNIVCLEPFSGSGTTALELQNCGIPCFSFEVNPLMYLIARVKMECGYESSKIDYWHSFIVRKRNDISVNPTTTFNTLYQGEGKKKWNYNEVVAIAIEKLRCAIDTITEEIYKDLFNVALASILLDVSNLYRNGKCLSYKKDWQTKRITEVDVYTKFDDKVSNELKADIANMDRSKSIDNKNRLYNEDSRVGIEKEIEDNSIDLVITSPPYLNSRDYTDTYMLELKTLGFTKTHDEIKALREKTLRSHVQIKWKDKSCVNNQLLQNTLKELENAAHSTELWNESILDMIRLYFVDMKNIFQVLYKKLKVKGRIYFNVSNSAYFNILINTLEICASIAENEGFKVIEIRDARNLKTSPQQKEKVENLLEGVIVLER